MALTVPDESLASVAEADAYHEGRGNIAAWDTLEGTRKEQLLRLAHDYLLAVYGPRWPADAAFGHKDEAIPAAMRNAACILALKAKAGDLMPESKPQVIEQTIGPMTKKFAETPGDGLRRFPEVERLVGPFLAPLPSPYTATLIRN